jgi:hypothetical protein
MKPYKVSSSSKTSPAVLSSVEALLAVNPETITAPALRAAMEKHNKEREEAEAERAFTFFTQGQNAINESVERLRMLRKKEEKEKKSLIALNTAMEEFKKDGDTAKFQKAQLVATALRF